MHNPLLARPEHHALLTQKILAWNAIRTLAARELARRSLLEFVLMTMPTYEVGWVHREICEILDAFIEACERQLGPRLIIELPPRIGKSELVSRKFPAFLLGRHPDWEVVCATYNQDLASDFGREVRTTFQDPIFTELFPGAGIRTDSNSIDFVKFTDKGSYTAVGIGGALTGRGAHCLPPGTRIATPDGERRIEDIAFAPLPVNVLTYDEHTRQIHARRVSAVAVRPRSRLYRITTTAGRVVEATGNHPFFVPGRGYVTTAELAAGDRLLCRVQNLYRAPVSAQLREVTETDTVAVVEHVREESIVFDLEVEGEHNFFANGILTHNCLLIDDPVKNREDADSKIVREATWKWYQTVARTRISPGGGIICCQTRWHQEDLVGKILLQAAANPDGDQWMRYSFPAIATKDEKYRKTGDALHPERWPLGEYVKLRATLDPREWSALYQQNPTPEEGILFKRDWIHYAHPPKLLNWYITTDFAIGEKNTNDFTVILPFAVDENDTVYFDMPVRARMSAMDIVEKLCDSMEQKKPQQVAIENVHISKTIGPYLRKRMNERHLYSTTWGYTATKDKVARSASLRGRMQQGKVCFHPLLKNLVEEELLPFPAARFDDFVDAASVGMLMLDAMLPAHGPPKPPVDPAPAWSYEWIQSNIARASGAASSHVPKHLNGKDRKPVVKTDKRSWR